MTPLIAVESMKGSTPMFSRRRAAEMASGVWTVESTRWPVMAARKAMTAVSESRISPTLTMSGSWRRMERRPLAKLVPVRSSTWT